MKTVRLARPPYPQTPETVMRWFRTHGIGVSDWATAFGLSRFDVIDLVRGRTRGYRSRAHRAAILLGLKPDPKTARNVA